MRRRVWSKTSSFAWADRAQDELRDPVPDIGVEPGDDVGGLADHHRVARVPVREALPEHPEPLLHEGLVGAAEPVVEPGPVVVVVDPAPALRAGGADGGDRPARLVRGLAPGEPPGPDARGASDRGPGSTRRSTGGARAARGAARYSRSGSGRTRRRWSRARPARRAAMTSRASSTSRPRPSVGRPVAFQSGPRVLPIPNAGRRRPSLRKSMVAHLLGEEERVPEPDRGDVHPELDPPRGPGERRHGAHALEDGAPRHQPVRLPEGGRPHPPPQRSTHFRKPCPRGERQLHETETDSNRHRPFLDLCFGGQRAPAAWRQPHGKRGRRGAPGRGERRWSRGTRNPRPPAGRRPRPRQRGGGGSDSRGGSRLHADRLRPWPRAARPPARATPRCS